MAAPQFARYDNLESRPDSCVWGCCGCVVGRLTSSIVKARVAPDRQKIEKTPKDSGMEYKSVTFLAADGIKIAAWEIVDPKNTKVALVNHPLMCTRWGSAKGFDGIPVDFMPMLKHLVTAGYNVVTYDHRCQGESEGGLATFGTQLGSKECPAGVGAEEWKDVLGAMDYIEQHEVMMNNTLVFVGQCMGSTAMLGVWERQPERVKKVKAFVVVMPVIGYNMTTRVTRSKLKKNLADLVEQAQWDQYKIAIANPLLGIKNVQCPTLFLQMKEEMYTYNPDTQTNDVEQVFEACGAATKEIVYIGRGTDIPFGKTGKRFEAYAYFNDHPEKLLTFLDTHASNA